MRHYCKQVLLQRQSTAHKAVEERIRSGENECVIFTIKKKYTGFAGSATCSFWLMKSAHKAIAVLRHAFDFDAEWPAVWCVTKRTEKNFVVAGYIIDESNIAWNAWLCFCAEIKGKSHTRKSARLGGLIWNTHLNIMPKKIFTFTSKSSSKKKKNSVWM